MTFQDASRLVPLQHRTKSSGQNLRDYFLQLHSGWLTGTRNLELIQNVSLLLYRFRQNRWLNRFLLEVCYRLELIFEYWLCICRCFRSTEIRSDWSSYFCRSFLWKASLRRRFLINRFLTGCRLHKWRWFFKCRFFRATALHNLRWIRTRLDQHCSFESRLFADLLSAFWNLGCLFKRSH